MSWQHIVGTGTPYDWTLWLWNAFLHATYWGAPDYKHLDEAERNEFADMVKTGDLFTTVEELKRCVIASGVDLPDEALTELVFNQITPGKPLPESDRKRLEATARKLYGVLVKLEVQEQQKSTVTNGAQVANAQEPGDGEKAPVGGTEIKGLTPAEAKAFDQHRQVCEWLFEENGESEPTLQCVYNRCREDGMDVGTFEAWSRTLRRARQKLNLPPLAAKPAASPRSAEKRAK